jgi:hypothetical protein
LVLEEDVGEFVGEVAVLPTSFVSGVVDDYDSGWGADGQS